MASSDGSLGSRVRRLREGLGLTQEDCACGAGLDATTWARMEEGRHKAIRLDTLCRIVAFFRKEGVDCTADWVLDTTPAPPPASS